MLKKKDPDLPKFIRSGDPVPTESDSDTEKLSRKKLIKEMQKNQWYKEAESEFNQNPPAKIITKRKPITIWGVIKKNSQFFINNGIIININIIFLFASKEWLFMP